MTTDNDTSATGPVALVRRHSDRIVSLAILLLGGFIIQHIFDLPLRAGQDALGPRLFPVVVGVGLVLLGIAGLLAKSSRTPNINGAEAALGEDVEVAPPPGSLAGDQYAGDRHWSALAWVLAGMVLGVALFKIIGFILAALTIFGLTARGFAGRFSWKQMLGGLGFILVLYFSFTKGLGLNLPTGLLWGYLTGG